MRLFKLTFPGRALGGEAYVVARDKEMASAILHEQQWFRDMPEHYCRYCGKERGDHAYADWQGWRACYSGATPSVIRGFDADPARPVIWECVELNIEEPGVVDYWDGDY